MEKVAAGNRDVSSTITCLKHRAAINLSQGVLI